ncbi:MAG: hypothetical protein ACQESK_00440 [Bacteroidota bacterium]
MQVNNLKKQMKTLGMSVAAVVFMSSCGSYQNVGAHSDGIYGSAPAQNNESRAGINNQTAPKTANSQSARGQYESDSSGKEDYTNYFKQQGEQISQARGAVSSDEITTDTDNYTSKSDYNDDNYYEDTNQTYSGQPGWGSNASNVNVNVYGNTWGGYGMANWGFYNPYFYGPRWRMWGPSWGYHGWRSGFGWGGYGAYGWGGYYGPAYYGAGWYGAYGYRNGHYPGLAYHSSPRNSSVRNRSGLSGRNAVVASSRSNQNIRGASERNSARSSSSVRSSRNIRGTGNRSSNEYSGRSASTNRNVRGASSRNIRSSGREVRSTRATTTRRSSNATRVRNSRNVNARSSTTRNTRYSPNRSNTRTNTRSTTTRSSSSSSRSSGVRSTGGTRSSGGGVRSSSGGSRGGGRR